MLEGNAIRRDLDALDQRPNIRACAGCTADARRSIGT
jgi:hypothetical protein